MSQIEKTIFRKYDIRGEVKEGHLSEDSMILLGKAFGTFIRRQGGDACIVGHDARSYSDGLARAYSKGLQSTGVSVIFVGQVLTPITQAAQYYLKQKYSGMITASHNPNGWSGLKQGIDYSITISGDDIQALYKMILDDDFENGEGGFEEQNVISKYADDVLSRVKIDRPLKLVVNARNGSAGEISPDIFSKAGAEVIKMFCDVDFTFPNGNPNPSDDSMMEELGATVRKEGADLGFAIDGDGDRLGIVDQNGKNVYPDRILALLARRELEKKPSAPIVFDVKCSQSLIDDIKDHGGEPIFSKTGYLYVKKLAGEHGAPLGGERSGHLFFTEGYYGIDDATFNGLKFLEYLSEQKSGLSKLVESLPVYYSSPVWHAHCPDEKMEEVILRIQKDFKSKFENVIDIDGARVVFEDGFFLIRSSSNMPVMVMVFEGKTPERLKEIEEMFREELKNYPEIDEKWENG